MHSAADLFYDSEVRRTTQLLGEVYAMKPTKKSVDSVHGRFEGEITFRGT